MSTIKNVNYFFIFTAILFLAACKTTSNTTVTSDVKGPTIIQKPVVADLEVSGTRVNGTATAKRSTPESEIKQMAVTDALKKSNSDVLVEPRYEINTSFKQTTVGVSGYPATYKDFRPMVLQDTMFIDRDQLSTTKSDRQKPKKNGRKRKIVAWTVGSVLTAIGGFFLTIFLI